MGKLFGDFSKKLLGVVVPLGTPFTEDESVDLDSLKGIVRFIIDKGIKLGSGALIPNGSTGQCMVLTVEEKMAITEAVMEVANGEVPVMVGCNSPHTADVIKLCKHAEECGADGVMVIPPYYGPPTEEIVLNHFKAINNATNLPIMVYNNPSVVGVDLSPETILKLSKLENVRALKDISTNLTKVEKTVRLVGEDLIFINGSSEWFEPEGYCMGMEGFISTIANWLPEYPLALWQAMVKGDFDKAREISRKHGKIRDLVSYVGQAGEYFAMMTEMWKIRGLDGGTTRTPLPNKLNEVNRKKLLKLLEKLNYKLAE